MNIFFRGGVLFYFIFTYHNNPLPPSCVYQLLFWEILLFEVVSLANANRFFVFNRWQGKTSLKPWDFFIGKTMETRLAFHSMSNKCLNCSNFFSFSYLSSEDERVNFAFTFYFCDKMLFFASKVLVRLQGPNNETKSKVCFSWLLFDFVNNKNWYLENIRRTLKAKYQTSNLVFSFLLLKWELVLWLTVIHWLWMDSWMHNY